MKHLLLRSLVIAIWLAILGICYVMWLTFHNPKTFVVKNFSYTNAIPVLNPILHPGDTLKYELEYCKYTDVTPTSKSYLMDGQEIPLTNQGPSIGLLPGCHTIERDVKIPETINPGVYYYDKELNYRINPFNVQKVYYYTQYFKVIPKGELGASETDFSMDVYSQQTLAEVSDTMDP